jgi:hypothetical protein
MGATAPYRGVPGSCWNRGCGGTLDAVGRDRCRDHLLNDADQDDQHREIPTKNVV